MVPAAVRFEPQDGPAVDEVTLSVDQLEALRLKDLEGLDQEAAADRMGVSRATFHRIITGARQTVAEALACGKAINIAGGHFRVVPGESPCKRCGRQRQCCCQGHEEG